MEDVQAGSSFGNLSSDIFIDWLDYNANEHMFHSAKWTVFRSETEDEDLKDMTHPGNLECL